MTGSNGIRLAATSPHLTGSGTVNASALSMTWAS